MSNRWFSKMKVCINQPYFLPYIGLMEKVKFSDVTVINDFSPISRRKRIYRRVRIIDNFSENRDARFITELVYHWHDGKPFNEIRVGLDLFKRQEEVLETIRHTYRKAPFFDYLFTDLANVIFDKRSDNLGVYNFRLIELLVKKLGINNKIVLASQNKALSSMDFKKTPKNFKNHATYMAFEICRRLKGNVYISGQSGPKYLDETSFANNNMEVLYQQINFKPYYQFNSDNFVSGLSVIDLIFNMGPRSADYIGENSTFVKELRNVN